MEQKQVDQKKIRNLKRIQDAVRYWLRKCENNANELARHIAFVKAIDDRLSMDARCALHELFRNRESEQGLLAEELANLTVDIAIEKGEEPK